MILSWGVILSLVGYCYTKILFEKDDRPGEESDGTLS